MTAIALVVVVVGVDAYPPEDVGGIYGYNEMLEVLKHYQRSGKGDSFNSFAWCRERDGKQTLVV